MRQVLITLMLAANLGGSAAARAEAPALPRTVAADAKLVEVYADGRFFEGPTWDPRGGKLYFTAFGATPEGKNTTQILRLDAPGKAAVWADETQGINGTCLSLEGRLLGAQAYGHRVIDYGFGADGPADPKTRVDDQTLNQPNDICQAPGGAIYFSDPDFKDRKKSAVYLLTPSGEHKKIISDMKIPNGLITSLDGKTLYVGDSADKLWRAYPLLEDGTAGPGRVFFNPDTSDQQDPDGMTIDAEGNLYFTGRGGVWTVSPAGELVGMIPVPVFCSNVAFGGPDGKTLFLTCKGKVYSLQMNVAGGTTPAARRFP